MHLKIILRNPELYVNNTEQAEQLLRICQSSISIKSDPQTGSDEDNQYTLVVKVDN